MLDVEHLKQRNDRYGQSHGDDYLKKVASVLKKNVPRSAELIAGYSGAEFASIIPNAKRSDATQLAQKVCDVLRANKTQHADSVCGVVTASIAVMLATADGACALRQRTNARTPFNSFNPEARARYA